MIMSQKLTASRYPKNLPKSFGVTTEAFWEMQSKHNVLMFWPPQ